MLLLEKKYENSFKKIISNLIPFPKSTKLLELAENNWDIKSYNNKNAIFILYNLSEFSA